MIRISKTLGILMMMASFTVLIIYTLWIFGLINGLDPELAVKVAVYAIVLTILTIISILGYIMATYTQPAVIKSVGEWRDDKA